MKTAVLTIFLFASLANAQNTDPAKDWVAHYKLKTDSTTQARLDSICKERGHAVSKYGRSTFMYCPDVIVDLPGKTVRITYNLNVLRWKCERCKREYMERAKPDTVIIWKKNNPMLKITR